MKENSPTQKAGSVNHDISDTINNVRNICFILPDGNMQFLNYGYLVSGKYIPEENIIMLLFTSDTVTLEGSQLESLFFEFMQHLPKIITCIDSRYNVLDEKQKSIVNRISINPNND